MTLLASALALSPLMLFSLALLAVCAMVFMVNRLSPKRFYIVRHGQTILNEQHIKQGADGTLNEKGRAQAEQVGRYLKCLHVDTIVSSPYERAQETARIIQASLGKAPIRITPLLAERRNPSAVIGKSTKDPEVEDIVGKTERGYHDDDYRYADEENFADLKKRAGQCVRYLKRTPGSTIVVVTHHALLQMLLSYVLYREALHTEDYIKLAFFNPAENGGVTICEYHPLKRFSKTRGWRIVEYNESISSPQIS